MGVYKKSIITDAGNELLAKVGAGQQTLLFSAAKTSDYAYPDGTDFAKLTDLQNVKQTVIPSNVKVINGTTVSVRALFGNEAIANAYLIQNIGLYAKDGDTDVLFAVSQAATPDQMPVFNGIAPSSFIYNISLPISQASEITLNINPAGAATVEDITEIEKQIADLKNTVVVTLPVSAWSETLPYTQTVAVPGMKTTDNVGICLYAPKNLTPDEVKLRQKLTPMITDGESGDGKMTFYCGVKKPMADFQVLLSGVSLPEGGE